MSERPTPETDAFIEQNISQTNWEWRVHSRRLERERDEAMESYESNKITLHQVIAKGVKVERERDEARETCERYRLEANALMLQRDEAREVLAEISLYLSVGMGDQSTTAKQYHKRILDGIKMLTDPILKNWKEAQKKAEYYRERYEQMKHRYIDGH